MQSDRDLLKQALEALDSDNPDIQLRTAIALRERLAQPEQEPVAWTPQVWWQFRPDGTLEFQKIKRTPNGAWEDYTTPPRREWVGLTDEEIKMLPQWYPSHETAAALPLIRAVEAKLKQRNT